MHKARSFFLELEIFLDHWNKYISRRGKKDEFKPVFEKATHDAFDSSDNYAMAAMLRNYIAYSSEVSDRSRQDLCANLFAGSG